MHRLSTHYRPPSSDFPPTSRATFRYDATLKPAHVNLRLLEMSCSFALGVLGLSEWRYKTSSKLQVYFPYVITIKLTMQGKGVQHPGVSLQWEDCRVLSSSVTCVSETIYPCSVRKLHPGNCVASLAIMTEEKVNET
jgi:hypothetical protein